MKVTLAKALMIKKQLVQKINDLQRRLLTNSCKLQEEEWVYDPVIVYNDLTNTIGKLVTIKSLINESNLPVQPVILLLSELKSQAKLLQTISIQPTKTKTVMVDGRNAHVEVICQNWKTRPELDNLIDEIKTKISTIQDELNTHNYKTTIELPFEI